eukprot:4670378-Amphidinium_carterae.3
MICVSLQAEHGTDLMEANGSWKNLLSSYDCAILAMPTAGQCSTTFVAATDMSRPCKCGSEARPSGWPEVQTACKN